MPMCENKLNQLLHKNPELINCLNRFITYSFIKEYAHIPYSKIYLSQYGIITPFQLHKNIDMDFLNKVEVIKQYVFY